MAKKVIGISPDRSNGGWFSGNAYYKSQSTSGFSDNWIDIGFMPEQIRIDNVSGIGDLEVAFSHEGVSVPSIVSSEVEQGSSLLYRKRNHQYLAIRGVNGSPTFRIEAW